MNSAFIIWLALQAVQPADMPIQTSSSDAAGTDVYTACFLRELSRLERRDLTASTAEFSMQNALVALRSCQPAKAELAESIERELAGDPAFADRRLLALELENRVMMAELPLLLLVRARGR